MISTQVVYGDLMVGVAVEFEGYSPDVMADCVARAVKGMTEAFIQVTSVEKAIEEAG